MFTLKLLLSAHFNKTTSIYILFPFNHFLKVFQYFYDLWSISIPFFFSQFSYNFLLYLYKIQLSIFFIISYILIIDEKRVREGTKEWDEEDKSIFLISYAIFILKKNTF